jgi:hypothetical protein
MANPLEAGCMLNRTLIQNRLETQASKELVLVIKAGRFYLEFELARIVTNDANVAFRESGGRFRLDLERQFHLGSLGPLQFHHHGVQDGVDCLSQSRPSQKNGAVVAIWSFHRLFRRGCRSRRHGRLLDSQLPQASGIATLRPRGVGARRSPRINHARPPRRPSQGTSKRSPGGQRSRSSSAPHQPKRSALS